MALDVLEYFVGLIGVGVVFHNISFLSYIDLYCSSAVTFVAYSVVWLSWHRLSIMHMCVKNSLPVATWARDGGVGIVVGHNISFLSYFVGHNISFLNAQFIRHELVCNLDGSFV